MPSFVQLPKLFYMAFPQIYSRRVLDDQTERRDEGEAAAGELCWEISQTPVSPGKSPDDRILDYFTLQPSSTFSAFQKVFYDDEGTNFIEEQVERRKRDTKLTRGRKGTLKIPLGQVVGSGWYDTTTGNILTFSSLNVTVRNT